MKHIETIYRTWCAFRTWHMTLMLDDAHDQVWLSTITSRMLQSSALKEILSQDFQGTKTCRVK